MSFPQRIVIIGPVGSGKTFLACCLSRSLGIHHIELDALYWGKNWTKADDFEEKVVHSLKRESWIVDGNTSEVRDLVWDRADLLIWLDYNWWVCITRLLRRTVRRLITSEELWNGNNYEDLKRILGKQSLFLKILVLHKKRQEFSNFLLKSRNTNLRVLRFKNPRQTENWLKSFLLIHKKDFLIVKTTNDQNEDKTELFER